MIDGINSELQCTFILIRRDLVISLKEKNGSIPDFVPLCSEFSAQVGKDRI